ncbi:hypothetical protein Vi05172_g11771 [Venturia inaequalis]|nr:hypothetical protein Vi05172_g11771 [Venturia inaequalis]
MGKRAASNSFEQQSSCKQGVLASKSCEQQSPTGRSPQMKRLMASSAAPVATNLNAATRHVAKMRKPRNTLEAEKKSTAYHILSGSELEDQIMGFMVKEQELEDLTRPQHNPTSIPFPTSRPLATAPIAHSPVDISAQDIDVDMCVDSALATPRTDRFETEKEKFPLMNDTDTDMDALMDGMGSLDLIKVRKRRGAVSRPPGIPFSRQRC